MVNFLRLDAPIFFAPAAFELAGPLKAGMLPETGGAYFFLLACFLFLVPAEIIRRLPDKK